MKKGLFILGAFICLFCLTGCTEQLEKISDTVDDYTYVYPDSKDVLVSLEQFNQLKSGMSEQEVWNILGGKCTNTGTTDMGIGEQYVTVSYGCNGKGTTGANVILMFQDGKLSTMSQTGLK